MDAQRTLTLEDWEKMTEALPIYQKYLEEQKSQYAHVDPCGLILMIRTLLTLSKPYTRSSLLALFRLLLWSLVATGYTLTGRYEKSLIVQAGKDGRRHCAVLVRRKG